MHAEPMVMNELLFRRQFFLGAEVPDVLAGWGHHRVNDQFVLAVHPDLSYTRVDVDGRSLLLLGYALDHRHPEWDDQTVLENVLGDRSTFEAILAASDHLAGRWAAIYLDQGHVRVFHDAVGVRAVYHCRDEDGVRCASSPGLLSLVTGRAVDAHTKRELEDAGLLDTARMHFWPGSGSAFMGVHRLLPNHYLDVGAGTVHRFWPHSPIPTALTDVAAARSMAVLSGTIAAGAARYPLAMSISAGLDSRVLLAAARQYVQGITFYTFKKPGMNALTPDIRVPRRMLRDLGVAHTVIPVRKTPSGAVFDAISASAVPVHQSQINQAAALLAHPPRDGSTWVTLNGNVAEVAQCHLARLPVTPENFAHATRMGSSAYAVEQFGAWHAEAAEAIAASKIDPWDLFFWEQWVNGWYATVRTERDVAEEVLPPYNSRAWLECMLGVDPAVRSRPDHSFFMRLIGDCWPELLDYPINPPDHVKLLNRRARDTVRTTRALTASAMRLRSGH